MRLVALVAALLVYPIATNGPTLSAADAPAVPATGPSTERIASWLCGEGTVAGKAAAAEAQVATGAELTSAAASPVRLELSEPMAGSITLAPGTTVAFSIDTSSGRELVLDVRSGAVQVDLGDKGVYRSVKVRCNGIEARAIRCSLIAEHRTDANYVALLKGALSVHGTSEKDAKAWIQLKPRQGFSDDASGGGIETLTARPQLDAPAASRASIRDQGHGPADAPAGSWRHDEAGARMVDAAMGTDAATGAYIAGSLARNDSQAGADAVARGAKSAPELAALFVSATAAYAPAAANDLVAAAVVAVPDHAGDVVGAVAAMAPDNAADIAVAALSAVPDKAGDVIAAAVKAAPASKDAILGIASALAPDAAAAYSAANP